jgi:hypothetical protein
MFIVMLNQDTLRCSQIMKASVRDPTFYVVKIYQSQLAPTKMPFQMRNPCCSFYSIVYLVAVLSGSFDYTRASKIRFLQYLPTFHECCIVPLSLIFLRILSNIHTMQIFVLIVMVKKDAFRNSQIMNLWSLSKVPICM